MFFDIYKYVYSESVFNTLYIEITQMLKNFLRTKSAVLKMPSFFFRELQLITVLLLIYELKYNVRLSKTVRDFPFSIPFHF